MFRLIVRKERLEASEIAEAMKFRSLLRGPSVRNIPGPETERPESFTIPQRLPLVARKYTRRDDLPMTLQNRSITTTLALLCLFVGAFATATFAQSSAQPSEEAGPLALPPVVTGPLTLSKTVVDTENNFLGLSTTAAAAFGPVRFTCPAAHTRGCTIRLDVSSQFWNIPSGTVAQMLISSTGGTINPSFIVNVDADTTGPLASVHTFQWMISGIPAGSTQTVNVSFDVSGGTAASGYRTETAQLYLN